MTNYSMVICDKCNIEIEAKFCRYHNHQVNFIDINGCEVFKDLCGLCSQKLECWFKENGY